MTTPGTVKHNPDTCITPAPTPLRWAVDNLRTMLVLFIVAVHSQLAYMSFLPLQPFAFDRAPFLWRSFPIIDHERALGFDLFSAWIDTFVMALFFVVSGLFVWPSLTRNGAIPFLRQRALRLGVPFAAAITLLMPIAHYPVYAQTAAHPGIVDYWRHWRALPFWPVGPLWFLWVLLALDVLAAALYGVLAWQRTIVRRLSSFAREHATGFLAGLFLASAFAYVPLALRFGPMPWFHEGPFSIQLSRPGQYAVYFFAGVAIGAGGIDRSLIAPDGPVARHWQRWLLAAALSFGVWLAISAKAMTGPAPLLWRAGDDLSYVLACLASSFCAIALAMRFGQIAGPWLRTLNRNAYGTYLFHYVFVVWLQFALLDVRWQAVLKFALVFSSAVALSGVTAAVLRRVRTSTMGLFVRP